MIADVPAGNLCPHRLPEFFGETAPFEARGCTVLNAQVHPQSSILGHCGVSSANWHLSREVYFQLFRDIFFLQIPM